MAVPTLTANSPSLGYIAWAAFHISYNGQQFSISAGNTSHIYTAWLYLGGSPTLVYSDTAPIMSAVTNGTTTDWTSPNTPVLGPDDLLLFVNKGGVPINVQTAQLVDGDIIANGTVTAAQIATNTITSNLIATGTILAGNIAAGAIGTTQLATGSVTAGVIASGTITTTQLSGTAIDGMTITGNNIQLNGSGSFKTSTSGARIEITSAGGYDSMALYTGGGAVNYIGNRGGSTITLNAATGALFNVGTISGGSFSGQEGIQTTSGQYASLGAVLVQNGLTVSSGGASISGALNMNSNQINAIGSLNAGGGTISMNASLNATGGVTAVGLATSNGMSVTSGVIVLPTGTATVGSPATLAMNTTNGVVGKASSSKKMKRDIVTIEDPYTVLPLKARHFRWKDSEKTSFGLIAEEVEELGLEPLLHRDEYGVPESVDYSGLSAILLGAVQSLNDRVTQLEKGMK